MAVVVLGCGDDLAPARPPDAGPLFECTELPDGTVLDARISYERLDGYHLVPFAGGEPGCPVVMPHPGTRLGWSSSGRYELVQRSAGLRLVDATTLPPRLIPLSGGSALGTWAPVDSALAYQLSNQLWVAWPEVRRAAGIAALQQPVDARARWSPDGTKLVWHDGGAIHLADVVPGEEAAPRQVDLPPASIVAWSPDGSWFIARADDGLWLAPVDPAEAPRQLVASRNVRWQVNVSPDGRMFAYVIDRENAEVFVQSIEEGAAPEELPPGIGGRDQSPAWSPDGRYLSYSLHAHPPWRGELVFARVDEEQVRSIHVLDDPVVRIVGEGAWAPDGSWLAVQVEPADNFLLHPYVIDLRGDTPGAPIPITPDVPVFRGLRPDDLSNGTLLHWSHESRYVAYRASAAYPGRNDLYVADLSQDPPRVRVVMSGDAIWSVTWTGVPWHGRSTRLQFLSYTESLATLLWTASIEPDAMELRLVSDYNGIRAARWSE